MLEGFASCKMLFDDRGRPADWVYLAVNQAFERLTGLNNIVGKRVTEAIPGIKESQPELFEIYGRVASTGEPEKFEIYFKPLQMWLNIKAYSPAKENFVAIFEDITGRKRAEETLRLSLHFLEITHQHSDIGSLLNAYVSAIKDYTDCEGVGIRMLDAEGGIPYQAYCGFSQQFYESESPLSIKSDHCMCINVIKGECDPKLPFYTPGGSFYLNATSRFLATVSEADKGPTRNVCNSAGYESVALIPLRWNSHILGLIHMADQRENMVPLALVEMLEKVAKQLGVTLVRARAEEALRETEEKYRSIFENSIEGIFQSTPDGRYIAANPAMAKIFGYDSPEELLAAITDIKTQIYIDPQRRADFMRLMHQDGFVKDFEYQIVRKDGKTAWIFENARAVKGENGEILYYEGFMQDITERKRAEAEIEQANRYLENTFSGSADGIGIVDLHGRIVHWNKAAEELYNYKGGELKGQPYSLLYADPGQLEIMVKQLRRDGFVRSYEIDMKKKDGGIFPCSLSIRLLKDHNNRSAGSITVARDLTDTKRTMARLQRQIDQREQAKQALVESEQKLVNIINFLPDATFVIDTNGKVIAWNKAIEILTGVKAQDMLGQGEYEYALLFYGERRPILIDLVLGAEKGIENYPGITKQDHTLTAIVHFPFFKGGEKYLFGKASALLDSHGEIVGSIESIRDITDHILSLHKVEGERLKFSKLESLSILAGGIAHDFNNILTAILGNIDLAMLGGTIGEGGMESLSEAEQACLRAQGLARQLLTFAKGGAPVKKATSLVKLLGETVKLSLAGSRSLWDLSLPDNLWSVEIDEGQISQVISNLLINADQAMSQGGIIKIAAENIIIEKGADLPLSQGEYVKIRITDQGPGIPKEYLDKIFDPYFSTKEKGSGLGLATAYSIIKSHSGHIKVLSQLRVGTTFEIYLPAMRATAFDTEDYFATLIKGQGKILVLDDDEKIRDVLCRMLAQLGYQAESASDGRQAIEKFVQAMETGKKFDAVILDLTIPGGMGGKETLGNLLRIDPQVKALASSGYSDDPIMAGFQKYGFCEVIAKPYKIMELSKILQEVLGENIL
jgi:PAS domain S-box-containing protein